MIARLDPFFDLTPSLITYRVAYPERQHFGIILVKLADTSNCVRGLFLSKKAVEEDTLGFGQVVMVRPGGDVAAEFTRTPEWMRDSAPAAAVSKKPAARRRPTVKKAAGKKTAIRKKPAARKVGKKKS